MNRSSQGKEIRNKRTEEMVFKESEVIWSDRLDQVMTFTGLYDGDDDDYRRIKVGPTYV